jgi:hypothetical protein
MPIQFITPSIISSVANTQVTGTITASQIATVNANTITSGTIPVAQIPQLSVAKMPTGSVLQVVRTTITTQASYTLNAGAIQSTALTASITPISSSSHVIVQMMASINSSGAGQGLYGEIRRGTSTTLNQGAGGGTQNYPIHWINTQNLANIGAGGIQLASQGWLAFDSPATTSATSYTFYVYGVNGAGPLLLNSFGTGTGSSVILLWEIAG